MDNFPFPEITSPRSQPVQPIPDCIKTNRNLSQRCREAEKTKKLKSLLLFDSAFKKIQKLFLYMLKKMIKIYIHG